MKILKKLFLSICIFLNLFFITNIVYAEHIHTDACYAQKEIKEEDRFDKIYHTHTDECYVKSCENFDRTITAEKTGETCPKCGENKIAIVTSTCQGCGASFSYKKCMNCGFLKDGDELINNHQPITIDYIKAHPKTHIICGYTEENYTLKEKETPLDTRGELICNKKIVSIKPEEETQIEKFNSNVIVTYLDEHTEIKQANHNFNKNKTYNGEKIKLTYEDFNCEIIYYSNKNVNIQNENNNKQEKENTKVETNLINENENVSIVLKNETEENQNQSIITNNESNEVIISNEVIDKEEMSFEREVGLKDTIVTDLEEEVDKEIETINKENLNKKNNMPIYLLLGFSIGIIGIVYMIIYIKRKK